MSLTRDESALIEKRDDMTAPEQNAVDHIMYEVEEEMKRCGLAPKGDDRMARVEAALVRFMLECRA